MVKTVVQGPVEDEPYCTSVDPKVAGVAPPPVQSIILYSKDIDTVPAFETPVKGEINSPPAAV